MSLDRLPQKRSASRLALDSTVGGLGDVWMRLTALYSLAALKPDVAIALRIPTALVDAAAIAWSDRLEVTDKELPDTIRISHLGLRHLWRTMCRGGRFISPFFQIQRADRKKTKWKHGINHILMHSVGLTPALHIPTKRTVDEYQGFHEFSALREFSAVGSEAFQRQAELDFPIVRRRLREVWACTPAPINDVVIFPSGTGHQIMPPTWAKAHLPDAVYAFHGADDFQHAFRQTALKVVVFKSVRELFTIAAGARRIVVTDSFPSHPLQAYSASTVVALTQQPRFRIVHPSFDGLVVNSAAICCPCANRARGNGFCDAGHDYCVSWSSPAYTRKLLEAL